MRRLALMMAALAMAVPLLRPQEAAEPPPAADAWQPYRSIKVLYAGWPGGSREKVFGEFLRAHFDDVGIMDLAKLTKATAEPYDVVIADWASQYGNDGYPKRESSLHNVPIDLGPDFVKPVIAMDYVSSQVRSQHKLDWL